MSSARGKASRFLDLYCRGDANADELDDLVSDWHASDDSERRSLAEFLGMTDEEYTIWVMDPAALPQIASARKAGRPLANVIADYVRDMKRLARPEDRTALHALGHWLQEHSKF